MMVFHAISKKILSNCHSVKSEPMLMNYEKCDQVLFPLLQQNPGPSSLKKRKIVAPYSRKKNQLYTSHPPSTFFKVAYPIDESNCTNRKN